jgi:hypothetical protein
MKRFLLLCVFSSVTRFAESFRPSTARIPRSSSPIRLGVLETYEYCLTNYQLPTESATSACLAAIGDFAAQTRSPKKDAIDVQRINAFFFKGAVAGILWSNWYALVDPIGISLAEKLATNDFLVDPIRIVISVFLDLFVMCPFLFASWDLPFPMLARGDPIENIPRKVQAKLAPVILENTMVWIFPNLVIYSIPLEFRVVVSSCTDAVWQMLLSEKIAERVQAPALLPAVDEQQVEFPLPTTVQPVIELAD